MRNGQNKRMRGRNRKNQNPLTRVYESNGPDVKIRGTASHIAEKYVQLARDAQASGDPVAAENYFQHAEHYFRMIAAAQEQFRQSQPFYRQEGGGMESREDAFADEGDDEGMGSGMGEQPAFGTREPQPYLPRDAQFYPAREQQNYGGRQQGSAPRGDDGHVDRLPSFITGGGQPPSQPHQGNGQNGHENQGGDRFPLHRRRRRHRGPRGEAPAAMQNMGNDGDEPSP
ncbi:MAG TPA: DUF4167 domain-containing protein [Xanthobacteraceae bacterium]|jgi:hypothetical protein|nr:DUF4167 domain-containing protein [Xanthobacteraceae bacterium]